MKRKKTKKAIKQETRDGDNENKNKKLKELHLR